MSLLYATWQYLQREPTYRHVFGGQHFYDPANLLEENSYHQSKTMELPFICGSLFNYYKL